MSMITLMISLMISSMITSLNGKSIRCVARLCLFMAMTAPLAQAEGGPARPMSAEWVEKWRVDLAIASEKMPEIHPNLFASRGRAAFEADLAALSQLLPSLSHHEAVVELARLVARFGDGHTRLTLPLAKGLEDDFFQGHSKTQAPENPGMVFGHLPVRFGLFDDGLFVVRVEREQARLAGARVVAVGGVPTVEALERIQGVISADNGQGLKDHLPARLAMPEILHAVGLAPSRNAARFELVAGDSRGDVEFRRVPAGATVEWASVVDAGRALPLYREDRGRNFWMQHLARERMAYIRFLEMANEDDETIADLAARFEVLATEHAVQRTVIDLRGCHGGDRSLLRPLLHALIRLDAMRRPGSLFVVTDRSTFSASTLFALALEEHTPMIVVGEAMSGRPKSYGDSRKMRLPQTGLTLRVSTRYWQGHPTDDRRTIVPHLPTPLRFADYEGNHDPALAAILETSAALEKDLNDLLAGTWKGSLGLANQSFPLSVRFGQSEGVWQMDVQNFEVSGLEVLEGKLHFGLSTDSGLITFEAEVHRGGIFGRGVLDGRELLLVLYPEA